MEDTIHERIVADLDRLTGLLCSTLVTSSIPRDKWKWTSVKLLGVASRLQCTANVFTPINRLPPEILCEVFFHLRPVIGEGPRKSESKRLPFKDLVVVTHTCQYWRKTAIAAPELWSQLDFRVSKKNMNNLIRLFIRRSSKLLLDADFGRGLGVITPYTHRLRTLRCGAASIQNFTGFCNRPAPLLAALHILPHPDSGYVGPLPTLFNDNLPSLRKLEVNDFNPFPNNNFRGLSSFRLCFSPYSADPMFWTKLFAMLLGSPQLKELSLRLNPNRDYFLPIQDIPTPVALRALQKLHIDGFTSTIIRQFLNFVDLASNGIVIQFANVDDEIDWVFPPILPPELSFHAVTCLEVIYLSGRGFAMQGTNHEMGIGVLKRADSAWMHETIFSNFAPAWTNSQHSLKELRIHINREDSYKPPPLSRFSLLETLVVRAPAGRTPISLLLQMLDINRGVPCPLLSTLDLSGGLNMGSLVKVLKARSIAGNRLQSLRLGSTRGRVPGDIKSVRGYVDELEIFDTCAESGRGMKLSEFFPTDLGEL